MPDLTPVPEPKSANSFASLLASFTGVGKKSGSVWDDSALLDDVSTISYEQALRTHRRVPPVAVLPEDEAQLAAAFAPQRTLPVSPEKGKKSASITIRLTESEETQLRERAAAAQLSVSAYLRSCIFEAESLRAQVKEALSQMKASTLPEPPVRDELHVKPTSNWRSRLLSRWPRTQV